MAFPVKMLQPCSHALLAEVLIRTLSYVSSVTAAVDVPALVETAVATVPPFCFQTNNDFGILVDQCVDAAKYISPTPEAFRESGSYTDGLLNDIAFSLAGMLITAHVILREQLPPEVTELMTRIEARLADRLQQDPLELPAVVVQEWGSLADADYRAKMIHIGRSFAHIFEEDRPIRPYYATAALAAAERLVAENVPDALAEEARAQLLEVLGDAISETDMRFFTSLFFRSYGISNLVVTARVALENGAELNNSLNLLMQVERLLQTLSVKSTESMMSPEVAEWYAKRISILEDACLLIAGAFYTLAVTSSYRDRIIMACNDKVVVVNGFVLPEFQAAGGELSDIQAFGFYLKSHSMTTAYTGWSLARVLELRDTVNAELVNTRAETSRRLQADNSVILRAVVERVIGDWQAECDQAPWDITPDAVLRRASMTLLTRINNPALSLADLLTDYLVEIRNNALLSALKTAIYQEFAELQAEPVADLSRQTGIARALNRVLMDFLIRSYGEPLEAVA